MKPELKGHLYTISESDFIGDSSNWSKWSTVGCIGGLVDLVNPSGKFRTIQGLNFLYFEQISFLEQASCLNNKLGDHSLYIQTILHEFNQIKHSELVDFISFNSNNFAMNVIM